LGLLFSVIGVGGPASIALHLLVAGENLPAPLPSPKQGGIGVRNLSQLRGQKTTTIMRRFHGSEQRKNNPKETLLKSNLFSAS
jgi:hypothetical protein